MNAEQKVLGFFTTMFVASVIGASIMVAAPWFEKKVPDINNPINASFQLENFCSATSVEDFNLADGVKNGVFLTAAHCVSDLEIGTKLTLANATGTFEAVLMAFDKDRDIAYLQTLGEAPKDLAAIPLNLSGLETGDHVTLLGYPFGLTSKAIGDGYVGEDYNGNTYVLSPAAGGFSGGTVVDDNGNLVGVVVAVLKNQFESHSSFTLAVTPESIKEFLEEQLGLNG